MTVRRVAVTAAGRVQGVFFRASTREEARRRRLSGWVRNAGDGTVLAEIQGPVEEIEAMVAFLRAGPGASEVTDLQVRDVPPQPEAHGFVIR